jgi:hypothetical protein
MLEILADLPLLPREQQLSSPQCQSQWMREQVQQHVHVKTAVEMMMTQVDEKGGSWKMEEAWG